MKQKALTLDNNSLFRILLLSILAIVINNITLYAQEDKYKEYLGEVFDQETKKPLVFATLTLEGTNISTITNTEGAFLLKVPEENASNNVIISFLGYQTLSLPLSNFSEDKNKIGMKELITELPEVSLIVPRDAARLVRETLKKRGENYIDHPTVMTAFYRETIKKRRKNVSLSEAVVNIYKAPYSNDRTDALKLFKARKSTDYSKLDTVALKLQGGPFNALFVDMVKYPNYIFSDNYFEHYNFSFVNSTRVGDKLIYVIKFEQKPEIIDPLYTGKLYIDAENKILTSAIYSLNITNKDLASKMFVRKKPKNAEVWPTEVAYRVDYREKDGKWYYGYSNVLLEFKVDWDKRLFNSVYSMSCEMAITDWERNTDNTIPKYKDRVKSNIILSDEAIGFADPDFWGEYNIIEPEKSIESAIKKIQRQLKRGKIKGIGNGTAAR
ncbi:carboxypeptidase-like regulatory domain-containing protein [Maribacter sp. MMG018]|uniref:carboxypeptidase-like regulatory domain-containing protein n=1 Tax=Maribacter sp. MMG018 TaxID=2822688 RepID=UPI001B37AA03|nr:carboxypeptidase-like regulatory domain-containing protein [Maribacter sp. MMG018]MBQ4916231.1 carboxypeptidase-like regulatory domain-containing protein [Maribacter sp. MMG018]